MPGDDPMIQIGQIRVPNAARPFPDPPPAPCPECARLRERVAELEREVAEWVLEAFCEGAYEITDSESERAGWWDSCAKSHIKAAGDRLVELGLWERHPDGVGRRWFYRPKQTAPPTGE